MVPLIELRDADILQTGIFPDLPKGQLALWRDAENVQFVDGAVEKLHGWSVEETLADPIVGLAQAFADGLHRVYYATGEEIHLWQDGATLELGDGYSPAGRWSFQPFGKFLLATNNLEPPQIWKDAGAGAMGNWGGVPVSRAKIVRMLQNFPVLFAGQEVIWPSLLDIEDFEPGPGKRAGSQFIRDLDGDVMAAEPLGKALAYYSNDSMGIIQFIGGESTFGIQPQLEGIGAVSINAVVPVGLTHYGMSRKGIWRTDGSSIGYIDEGVVNRWLNDNIDWSRAEEVVGFHHEAKSTVCFFFPCEDDVVRGLGFRYKTGSWTKFKGDIKAALPQQVFNNPIVAVGDTWGFFDQGDNAGTDPLEAWISTAALDIQKPSRFKLWDNVRVHREGTGTVQVRFGFSNAPADVPEWTEWATLAFDNWLGRESVYLTMELRSTAIDVDWRIGGIDLFGEITGSIL